MSDLYLAHLHGRLQPDHLDQPVPNVLHSMLQLTISNLGEEVGDVPGGGRLATVAPQITAAVTENKIGIKWD